MKGFRIFECSKFKNLDVHRIGAKFFLWSEVHTSQSSYHYSRVFVLIFCVICSRFLRYCSETCRNFAASVKLRTFEVQIFMIFQSFMCRKYTKDCCIKSLSTIVLTFTGALLLISLLITQKLDMIRILPAFSKYPPNARRMYAKICKYSNFISALVRS